MILNPIIITLSSWSGKYWTEELLSDHLVTKPFHSSDYVHSHSMLVSK